MPHRTTNPQTTFFDPNVWKLLLQWIHRLKNSGETGPLPVTLQILPVSIGLRKRLHRCIVILWWKEIWLLRFPLEGNARWIGTEKANTGFPGCVIREPGCLAPSHTCPTEYMSHQSSGCLPTHSSTLSLTRKKKSTKLNYAVTILSPIPFACFWAPWWLRTSFSFLYNFLDRNANRNLCLFLKKLYWSLLWQF